MCALDETDTGATITGAVLTSIEDRPSRIDYRVELDAGWQTRSAEARIDGGPAIKEVRLASDGRGRWTLDGQPFAEGNGCVDVDLGWTPATNTLPIRRLGLQPGESGPIRAVWVRFPELDVVVADQVYECVGRGRYRYSSGTFSAVLDVDEAGLVTDYEGLWKAVARS